MKIVKKFTTFDDLKSSESERIEYVLTVEKHNEFEKVIMDIKCAKVEQKYPDGIGKIE